MKKITISYKIGQYLIFEFFPVLEESRVFPLFDDISHMILFTIYLDYSFIGNKSYFRYVVLKILFQALYLMIKRLKSTLAWVQKEKTLTLD